MKGRKVWAKGRPRGRKAGPNKLEAEYELRLRNLKASGLVDWYAFEPAKFRLADATTYTPDFIVMLCDGMLEAHEVKGFMEEDANVKLKVFAETYPFRTFLVTKKAGSFILKEV